MYNIHAYTLQRCNSIKVIENLSTLTNLQVAWISILACVHNYTYVLIITQVLDLSGNSISSLEGLEGLPCLYDINVEENEVFYNYYYIHVHVECMLPYLESTST